MARLLLLLTGGTLLMTEESGERITLNEERTNRDLLQEVPSLGRVADLETRLLFHMDSADMQPTDWLTLAREVHDAVPRYDGIVIVHGTDTMAYTASALAFILGPLPKPVVFTGSQKPLTSLRTDARQNLIDAATVATLGVPEVSIVMHSRALRGARATKKDAWGFDAFESPHVPPLVDLGLDVEIGPHVRAPAALAPFDERLEARVLPVRVIPGLDPSFVRGAVEAGVKGLVLEGYGTGNVPRELVPALSEAKERGVAVVVVSQCLRGFVNLELYDGGVMSARAGVLSAKDMTVEAAVAKLMVGLGRYGALDGGDALRAWFESSIVGERDV